MTLGERRWLMAGLILVGAAGIIWLMPPRLSPELRATRIQGDSVVAAIERYRQDHSRLPDSLAELVPQYVAAIPTPPWGLKAWRYKRWIGDSSLGERDATGSARDFTLAVSSSRLADSIFYWSTRRQRWALER